MHLHAEEVTQSTPVSTPTSRESVQLASLVPLHAAQAAPTSVPDILSRVFDMCRNRWVADFLFSTDMTPLSALTAPINLNHAISCTVTMTSVERFIGLPRCVHAPPNPFDMHMQGDYVFVPAFSVGPLSVGFGIQNCAVECQADWGSRHGEKHTSALSHFRYVRDDSKGILVDIRDEKHSDFYKVDYMAHESPTKRIRSFLTVERDAVQKMLREDTAGLDPQKLLTAIRVVQTCEEFRDCPYCGNKKPGSCACKVQLQTPKHPLDFDSMLTNMTSYLGSFEGITAARFCTAGMELLSARLGSRITIDCRMNTDILDRLSRWAITDQLKNVKEDPIRCIMPAGDTEMTDPGFGSSSGLGTSSGLGSSNGFGSSSGFASGEATEVEMGGETREQEMDAVQEMDAWVDEMTKPMKDVELGTVTTEGLDSVLGLNKDGLGSMATEAIVEQLSPATTEGDDDVELANEIAREAQLAYQAENAIGEQRVPNGTGATGVEGLHGYHFPDDVTQSEEARMEQEKERKAELRRQRNREAAQRSNAKRKQKNDTLKAELHASHTKAAELRAKELLLREENIRLRKMMSSS